VYHRFMAVSNKWQQHYKCEKWLVDYCVFTLLKYSQLGLDRVVSTLVESLYIGYNYLDRVLRNY